MTTVVELIWPDAFMKVGEHAETHAVYAFATRREAEQFVENLIMDEGFAVEREMLRLTDVGEPTIERQEARFYTAFLDEDGRITDEAEGLS